MHIILGPFHPDLENAIAEDILQHKKTDLLCPLLILTPSDRLRRRLKTLLAYERQLCLLNVQILTFYQLALRLWEEISHVPPRLGSDWFFEEALRQMIRHRQPGAERFAGLEERAGGCAALWQTLRDLRDGSVDPAVAIEALGEGHFSRRAGERLSELLVLFEAFQRFCGAQHIIDQSRMFADATGWVSQSRFLRQFDQVFYYGFYDLTQIQLDFFQSVARSYPTTLFFPLLATQPKHDAWSFAQRFYERHIQGLHTEPLQTPTFETPLPALARVFDAAETRSYRHLPAGWKARIVSAFGVRDEVAAAAKEILKLLDGGARFHEIGVVARTLETYGPVIQDVFDQHKIPVAGDFEQPLAQFPLIKAVILLLHLRPRDFLRSQVIDLLSSPYFRCEAVRHNPPAARPDLWDLATRELAITKGPSDWRRLRRYDRRGLALRQVSQDDEPRRIGIPATQIDFLAEAVETLAGDLLRLPEHASWHQYVLLWQSLLQKYLGVVRPAGSKHAYGSPSINATIFDILDELSGLDRVADRVTLTDFSHTLQHWLERATVTDDRRNVDGVMVLSATAARGLSFRALLLLGMNEGVFPRTIREDAFLRERDREVLERDLGYKVSQKLSAFDEEKLLFTLLAGAAGERLDCFYQRADEAGRALAPSWYLDELKRGVEKSGERCEIVDVPRGLSEKAKVPPFDSEALWTPKELILRLRIEGQDPAGLIEASVPLPTVYLHGQQAIAALEQSGGHLLSYDGALADFAEYWTRWTKRGLSPTALETYARCPFQFFARHVLGLESLDRPEESLGPNPAEFGELGHAILNRLYQALIDGDYFSGNAAHVNLETLLQSVAARIFLEYEENHPIGYTLAWHSLKTRMIQTLHQVIAQDLREMAQSGFSPVGLETDVTARMPGNWPEPVRATSIRGRMDRIDRRHGGIRVIDYKFKLGAKPAAVDKDLVRAALRGERLQPPFYDILARAWAEEHFKTAPEPSIEAKVYFIAPRWSGGPLIPSGYSGDGLAGKTGAQITQTIADLAEGVRSGRFFLSPGAHCGHCDVATICRKNHPPSRWRAENDPVSAAFRLLRKKTSSDDEQDVDFD
jgi:ATP-dependent helicase/nuclease subunit B